MAAALSARSKAQEEENKRIEEENKRLEEWKKEDQLRKEEQERQDRLRKKEQEETFGDDPKDTPWGPLDSWGPYVRGAGAGAAETDAGATARNDRRKLPRGPHCPGPGLCSLQH